MNADKTLSSTISYPWTELFASSLEAIPLFAYGSLVDPVSASRSLQYTKISMSYAVACGVKRVFNYKMPQRFLEKWGVDPNGNHKAALNLTVTGCETHQVNGSIIYIDRRDFEQLLLREEGYDLVAVKCSPWLSDSQEFVYPYAFVASAETAHGCQFIDAEILPVPGYLDLCVRAARSVSHEFGDFFCQTTFDNRGLAVHEYSSRSSEA